MASPDVCEGLQPMEAPAIVFALTQMEIPSRTSEIFCFTVFGLCPYPPVSPFPFNFSTPSSSIQHQEYYFGEPLQVVHISDVHVDHNYTTGSSFNCSEPICCHVFSPSEAPGVTPFGAGPFGHSNCDAPVSLEESMYDAIRKIVPGRSFTIFSKSLM